MFCLCVFLHLKVLGKLEECKALLKALCKAAESQFTHHTKTIHASDAREMTDASTDQAYCEKRGRNMSHNVRRDVDFYGI